MHSAAVSRMAAVCARHNRTERLTCVACNMAQGPTPCCSSREPHIPYKPRMHQACLHHSHRITLAGAHERRDCTPPTSRNIQPSQPGAGTPRCAGARTFAGVSTQQGALRQSTTAAAKPQGTQEASAPGTGPHWCRDARLAPAPVSATLVNGPAAASAPGNGPHRLGRARTASSPPDCAAPLPTTPATASELDVGMPASPGCPAAAAAGATGTPSGPTSQRFFLRSRPSSKLPRMRLYLGAALGAPSGAAELRAACRLGCPTSSEGGRSNCRRPAAGSAVAAASSRLACCGCVGGRSMSSEPWLPHSVAWRLPASPLGRGVGPAALGSCGRAVPPAGVRSPCARPVPAPRSAAALAGPAWHKRRGGV
jgi:hypothetical protein